MQHHPVLLRERNWGLQCPNLCVCCPFPLLELSPSELLMSCSSLGSFSLAAPWRMLVQPPHVRRE